MEITRHENNGILQSFTVWSEAPCVVVVHEHDILHSITQYYGTGQFGAVNERVQANAFPDAESAQQFILGNNLIAVGKREWHEDTPLRVVIPRDVLPVLVFDIPELIYYMKSPVDSQGNALQPIQFHPEPDGIYIYLKELHPQHRAIFEMEKYKSDIQEK